MNITTLSSREFNQSASEAKKAANKGPVFITDRGEPAHVLINIDTYKKLTGSRQKIADLLAMPGTLDADFDAPRLLDMPQAADLT